MSNNVKTVQLNKLDIIYHVHGGMRQENMPSGYVGLYHEKSKTCECSNFNTLHLKSPYCKEDDK